MEIALPAETGFNVLDYREAFPNVSFPESGPDPDFLTDNGAFPVCAFKPYDRATQRLEPCAPYLDGGTVYTMHVVDLTPEEIETANAIARLKTWAELERRIASYLLGVAKERNFDDFTDVALCLFSTNQTWEQEARTFSAYQTAVWEAFYTAKAADNVNFMDTLTTITWP